MNRPKPYGKYIKRLVSIVFQSSVLPLKFVGEFQGQDTKILNLLVSTLNLKSDGFQIRDTR